MANSGEPERNGGGKILLLLLIPMLVLYVPLYNSIEPNPVRLSRFSIGFSCSGFSSAWA